MIYVCNLDIAEVRCVRIVWVNQMYSASSPIHPLGHDIMVWCPSVNPTGCTVYLRHRIRPEYIHVLSRFFYHRYRFLFPCLLS